MTAGIIVDSQHIEMEGLNVVVQSLMIKEEFSEQTKVLTIDLRMVSIDLKHRQIMTSIDLITRWTTHFTLLLQTQTSTKSLSCNSNNNIFIMKYRTKSTHKIKVIKRKKTLFRT